jgi:Lon-like ATP-dependent protease
MVQVIELSGYTEHEKMHIARKYLEPEVLKNCSIPDNAVQLTDSALDTMVKQYCRESGVRGLKKQLEKVYRKAALKLATSEYLTVCFSLLSCSPKSQSELGTKVQATQPIGCGLSSVLELL